jgi:hypothetical protein
MFVSSTKVMSMYLKKIITPYINTVGHKRYMYFNDKTYGVECVVIGYTILFPI